MIICIIIKIIILVTNKKKKKIDITKIYIFQTNHSMLGTKIPSILVVVKQKSIYYTNVSSCCDGTSESSGRMSV